ncbi:alpha-galactosidase [Novosphingobium sp. BL-52-GroH]|uniref:alpha-galactosidase n=1 Tax=Novosphingobium sp. BL-52-GroH TaxID=3349877 RepID=UPI00385135E7
MRRGINFGALCLVASVLGATGARAEVIYDPATRVFRLVGGETEYDLGIDPEGYVQSLHWGAALGAPAPLAAGPGAGAAGPDAPHQNLPQEFAGQGEGFVPEPGIKVAFSDGNRDLVLRYAGHRIAGNTLFLELRDIARPLLVTLRYDVDPATGVVSRSAVVRNGGKASVRLDQFLSATFTLPYQPDYRLSYMTGRHASEWTMNRTPVTGAATVMESRRGSTSYHANPWFSLDREGLTTEESGPVWFGALGWSGSWRIGVGRDLFGRVRMAGGFNPYDFAWTLKPGETLESPVFHVGYSDHGRGGAARLMHRFVNGSILPEGSRTRPRKVLYNSWEATGFDVTEAGQMALAEKAASIGVERFVMDDGWFGARDSDRAGLGDWSPSRTKFPNGLKPLIDKVARLGMEFGLWVEPEMVNADSALYRAHPDWVMNFPGRPRTEARNQLVLNLARTDVRDHVLAALDRLLSENNIRFIKWDYNRTWSEPGWPERAAGDQQRIYVDYVRNLYFILAELRRRHPGVEFEACSSGGGRVDLGILRYSDQVWTSDNTDPFERLAMQGNFTSAYPASVMMAWTTEWGDPGASLEYRFLSAMQGGLGIGNDLNAWTPQDFRTAKAMVAAYKRVRATVQHGELYRLAPPDGTTPYSDTLYVAADRAQAVWFHMGHSVAVRDNVGPVLLRGLDADGVYAAAMIDGGALPEGIPAKASGAWWMSRGGVVPLKGQYAGVAVVLSRQ